jgi:hypothetical protein
MICCASLDTDNLVCFFSRRIDHEASENILIQFVYLRPGK